MISASSVAANWLRDRIVAFASLCSACACSGKAAFSWPMSETNGSETLVEASNWLLAHFIGLRISRPPYLAGKASSSLSASLKACLPVKAGPSVHFRQLYNLNLTLTLSLTVTIAQTQTLTLTLPVNFQCMRWTFRQLSSTFHTSAGLLSTSVTFTSIHGTFRQFSSSFHPKL